MYALLQAVHQPYSRPLTHHASTRDTWTLTWVNLCWGHCSVFLVLVCTSVFFFFFFICVCVCVCPPRVCFPVLCKFGSSMVGLMVTSSKSVYAIPRSTASRAPVPAAGHCWPVPPQETLKHSSLSLCGVSGSWCTQVLFEPSERLWQVWGLSLNVISSLLPSCWGSSFALGRGVSPQRHSSTAQPSLQCCAATEE